MDSESEQVPGAVVCRGAADCDDLDLRLSKSWLRIAIAGVFAGQGMVFSLALNMTPPPYATPPYYLLHGGLILSSIVVVAFLGGPLFASTWAMFRARRISIEGLFTLSLVGAFVGSVVGSITGEGDVFYEVVAVVIAIYTFGRMLGERSQAKLQQESARLRERFDRASVADSKGEWVDKNATEVRPGERVRVGPGDAFSLDGLILEGVGYVEETALTGEPLPVVRRPGDRVRAGTWAIDSQFVMQVEGVVGERELDLILKAVEQAGGAPSELQTQANRLIQIFLPLVVGVSLVTAVGWAFWGTWIDAVLNSMAVLLVACPCALGLATPVAISHGLFRLAQMGLVSRDGVLIDALARTRQIFFDKTGTLSESALRVVELWVADSLPIERADLLAGVLEAEAKVAHPTARALSRFLLADKVSQLGQAVKDLQLIPGKGMRFTMSPSSSLHSVAIGEAELGQSSEALEGAHTALHNKNGKRVYVWVDDTLAACFVLEEVLRAGAEDIGTRLQDLQVKVGVLTGDPEPRLRLPESIPVESGLSSLDKVNRVLQAQAAGDRPILVGDGINDAAAMRAASASIAMGSGTGLARSSATGQLSGDRLEVIPDAIRVAREIQRRLRGNLRYAAAYNVVGMVLAMAGWLHPVVAAMIMLVSSFWVTLRALRSV